MQYRKWKATMLGNLNYFQYVNIAPMENAWFRPQWNIRSWFIALMEKAWFNERLFFIIAKDEKIHHKYTISLKISFMDYMKWAIVLLPVVVFEKIEVAYIFLLLFFFSRSFSIGKRSTLAKIWGACSPRHIYSVSTGCYMNCDIEKAICHNILKSPYSF